MILVDTSVWIRYVNGKSPYLAELRRLLIQEKVAGHELVYGELLVGDTGGRRWLIATYERMFQVAAVPHRDVVALVRGRDLHGRGVGWIDIHLLASALVGGLRLWTADTRFAEMAGEFGIAYHVGSV